MKLAQALVATTNKTKTTNGMVALKSSKDACVDLFYKIGASRGKDIIPQFVAALDEDKDVAIRIALWARDVREGIGERQLFRSMFRYLAENDYKTALKMLPFVPELGRWDDVLIAINTPIWKEAVALIRNALQAGNGLCAKWMPRKGELAARLRNELEWSPKHYRKTLVHLSNTVETKMCAKDWDSIEYGKLPSVASARYQKAFGRNDNERYVGYLNSLQKGEAKINAGAVYPYDIVKSVMFGNAKVANEQWKALPNFVAEGVDFLPVVDVSGSMTCPAGGNGKLTCLAVALSLGLYLSERCTGQFKDRFITFSNEPELQTLKGDFATRLNSMKTSKWTMNTDLEKVFDLILQTAMKHRLKQEDLPEYVVILSDMQFDAATTDHGYGYGRAAPKRTDNLTAHKMIKNKFKALNYDAPKIIYWNLNAHDNVPVKTNQEGAVLISGFSPSIMKSILSGKTVTPRDTMLEVVGKDRYNWNK
jgi:hypothetical protein